MLRRSKHLVVAAVLAASAAIVVTGPTPAFAASPCQGRAVAHPPEFQQTVVVAGAYTTAGATDVRLPCGVVNNGVTVARWSDKQTGPVAAVWGTTNLGVGTVSICYELHVTYLDRAPTYSDNCP